MEVFELSLLLEIDVTVKLEAKSYEDAVQQYNDTAIVEVSHGKPVEQERYSVRYGKVLGVAKGAHDAVHPSAGD